MPHCDICKIINQREREATSKCVECQKLMCRTCVSTHQQMKITANHSIYELEIEKDIMCKQHPNEQVRFYCEACEMCVCVPCTYTEHRDHDLVDFKEGITHHKDKIEENLKRCRFKISELRSRCEQLRQCETRMIYAQNEIHNVALKFVESIREREKNLLDELNEFYGEETNDYLKKKDDLETFLEQLKSTCNLTEMVCKGKDIEMLLLKKQLCEKFDEFQDVQLDPLPRNINKKVIFVPGKVDLGKLIEPELNRVSTERAAQPSPDKDSSPQESDNNFQDVDNEEIEKIEKEDKTTQIGHRDLREILGDKIKETEVQTDIRMIHELQAPNRFLERDKPSQSKSTLASRTDSKYCQTDTTHPPLSNQSSVEEDSNSNAPVDRNKLGRRVRRHVKPGCSIAVLPDSEIIIIDPESNCLSILDRRGKFKYGMSNSNKPCSETGHQSNVLELGKAAFGHLPKLDRGIRILTPQGTLVIRLENEAAPSTPATQAHSVPNSNSNADLSSSTNNTSNGTEHNE